MPVFRHLVQPAGSCSCFVDMLLQLAPHTNVSACLEEGGCKTVFQGQGTQFCCATYEFRKPSQAIKPQVTSVANPVFRVVFQPAGDTHLQLVDTLSAF